MTRYKASPGPWTCEALDENDNRTTEEKATRFEINDHENFTVAITDNAADARLITAGPFMFAALKRIAEGENGARQIAYDALAELLKPMRDA